MNIIYIVLGITSVSFLFLYIRAMKKYAVLSAGLASLYIAHTALLEAKEESAESSNQEEMIHKENFIKFLSDSRDWAYEYIEEVQAGLNKFIKEVEPDIEYYNKYGSVVEGMVAPHDTALKKISKEFEELKKLLPEEANDRL